VCFIHHPFKIYTSNIVNHHCSNMLVNSSSMRNSSLLSSSAKFGIHIENLNIHDWLVVYLSLWKIWKSVGIIIPNIWKVIIQMFQTTNQYITIIFPLLLVYSLWKPLLTIIINHVPNIGWLDTLIMGDESPNPTRVILKAHGLMVRSAMSLWHLSFEHVFRCI